MGYRAFADLKVGDTFPYQGVDVTVLGEVEPHTDRFGRTLSQFWAKRLDTGAEGWIIYGPGGVFPDDTVEPVVPLVS